MHGPINRRVIKNADNRAEKNARHVQKYVHVLNVTAEISWSAKIISICIVQLNSFG